MDSVEILCDYFALFTSLVWVLRKKNLTKLLPTGPKDTHIDGYFLFCLFCILFLIEKKRTSTILFWLPLFSCPDTTTNWTLCKLLMLTSFIQFRFRGHTTVTVRKVLHLLTGVHRNEPFVVLLRHFTSPLSSKSACVDHPIFLLRRQARPLPICIESQTGHEQQQRFFFSLEGAPRYSSVVHTPALYLTLQFGTTDLWLLQIRCSNMLQTTPYV